MAGMTLFEARGRILEVKPNASKSGCGGWINKRIRNVIDHRTWSDLIRIGQVSFADQYTTGTVSLTPGSATVTGVGTAWPTNDVVNTVLDGPILESPGIVEVTPASMDSIEPGKLLVVDAANPSVMELVAVQAVTPSSFFAYFRYQHAIAATITQSRLAGRQFRTTAYSVTVKGVVSATDLRLEMVFGGPAQAAVSYSIYTGYVSPSPTARRLMFAWDAVAGQTIGTMKQLPWLNLLDPQRSDSGNQPQELVQTVPSLGGTMQWECYPLQTAAYQLMTIYQDGWPALVGDEDRTPFFMNPEIFISGACADALRTKVIQSQGKQDPYFDPNTAGTLEQEYAILLDQAVQSDQGRWMTMLQSYREQMTGGRSGNWDRAHAVEASAPWGGY